MDLEIKPRNSRRGERFMKKIMDHALTEISEINCMLETVEAESEAEAMAKVKTAYENGDIKLTDTNGLC